ncbi:hypothetical protein Slin15195_G079330 [Septoria linicola]|uniref:Uncharacterized protein n=1 Tax=Septoria linicola TaxID=215465 RepID=A0A9Q9ELQ7_9PEZI|nr:hypothetical protein Slin14017_G040530 [Septoria linicola]USW54614.1 hypothetical protein Slin15195_G079330 [Septoria linicola]
MSLRSSLLSTARNAAALPANAARRSLSTSSRSLAWKETQDKDSLKRESYEYTLTGTDEGAAETQETAFGSKDTSPEGALSNAEKERERVGQPHNPLDVSPANVEVSKAATQRPEHDAVDEGLPKEPSKGGKSAKAGAGRRYATESEANSPNAGPGGLNAGNEFSLKDKR